MVFYVFEQDSALEHRACKRVFGSQDAWFHALMLLSADLMNIIRQWTRLSLPSKQVLQVLRSSNWQHQACTCDTLWRQLYVTTSKEYLIICHILLKYFELVFLRLQLVKILCKLVVIWVNYGKKTKRGLLWNTMYIDTQTSCNNYR